MAIELLQELVRMDSQNPPGNETAVAKFVYDWLSDKGIQTELVRWGNNRYNVSVELGKGAGGLMLNAHLDTVPFGNLENWKQDPLAAKIIRDKMYGRGTCDTKSGVAAIMAAAAKFSKDNFKKKLLLTFVGDEENLQQGSEWLIKNKPEIFKGITHGVMAEPTLLNLRVVHKGVVFAKAKFFGKAAHGSKPWLGENAILKANKFMDNLQALEKNLAKKKDPMLGTGTINVGKISGGTKVNIVPEGCEVEIDRRITRKETIQEAIKQLQAAARNADSAAKLEVLDARPPLDTPLHSKIIKVLHGITKTKILGESGYTEAGLYSKALKIQCIVCGPGDSKLAHVANEWVSVKMVQKAERVYENLIRRWCT